MIRMVWSVPLKVVRPTSTFSCGSCNRRRRWLSLSGRITVELLLSLLGSIDCRAEECLAKCDDRDSIPSRRVWLICSDIVITCASVAVTISMHVVTADITSLIPNRSSGQKCQQERQTFHIQSKDTPHSER